LEPSSFSRTYGADHADIFDFSLLALIVALSAADGPTPQFPQIAGYNQLDGYAYLSIH
jgi:hypothetical protein